jgi:D-alanyl-lipoteichoic acid acyltransferase DltB (MBOAT superfamily)
MRQILWGLFKKIVIADNCAQYANIIFNNSSEYSGSTLVLGAIFFTFQIYGDFSGYSDIAIGTSRLFGFNLKQNFAFPYFSRDIAEFWRRWHISLSSWFRDYLYIPLGGSRGRTWNKIRNVFIIFLVSGFWHGANWTFIIWGALNALYFLPIFITNNNRNNLNIVAQGKYLPNLKEFLLMSLTFILTVFAWIFFRAENIGHAISYINNIFSPTLFESSEIFPLGLLLLILFFLSIEWMNRNKQYGLEKFNKQKFKFLDVLLLYTVFWSIVIWNSSKEVEFIYFQF